MIASKIFTHVRDFFAVSTSWSTWSAAFLFPIAASSFARFSAFSGFYDFGKKQNTGRLPAARGARPPPRSSFSFARARDARRETKTPPTRVEVLIHHISSDGKAASASIGCSPRSPFLISPNSAPV